jgi:hypothetical protein
VTPEDNLSHEYTIEVSEQDDSNARGAIEQALLAYNASSAPPANYLPLILIIRDSGQTIIGPSSDIAPMSGFLFRC